MCGKFHIARDRHCRKYISDEIKRLKEKLPSDLLTIEDMDEIYHGDLWKINVRSNDEDEIKWTVEDDTDSDLSFWTGQQGC